MEWQVSAFGWDEMCRVDLNRDRREIQRAIFTRAKRCGFVIGLLLLLAGAVFLPTTMRCLAMQQTTQSILRKTAFLVSRTTAMNTATSVLQSEQESYRTALAARARRKVWGDLLASIAAAAPHGIYLNSLQIDSMTWRLQVSGTADDLGVINQFMQQMNQSPAITNANIVQTGLDENAGRQVRFQASALSGLTMGG